MTYRVVVVEPDDLLRVPLVRALRARGVGVDAFVTAREVIAALADGASWPKALVDLTPPDGDGATVAEKLRAYIPEIDVTFVTGGADGELLCRAHGLGTVLWKPLGMGPLCERFVSNTRRSGVVRRQAVSEPAIARRR